jgi:hypothetical protein
MCTAREVTAMVFDPIISLVAEELQVCCAVLLCCAVLC